MLVRFTSIIATVSMLAAVVSAKGQIAQVVDASSFCVFLPPSDSTDRIVSNTEWNANSFCIGNTPLATGAEKLPNDFIKSAHFVKTDAYVQVTGQMDYTKANLVGTDGGGQMDIRAPMGSSCAGWKYYVNLIEPTSNTYCMRCCNDDRTCNRGISEKGCAHIIPGDYSGPNDGTGVGNVTPPVVASSSAVSSSAVSSVASVSSSIVSSAVSSVAPSSVSPAAAATSAKPSTPLASPSGVASSQSVNGGSSSSKPFTMVVGAGLLVSVATFLA